MPIATTSGIRLQALVRQMPEVVDYPVGLAVSHNKRAVFYMSTGHPPRANAEYRKALEMVKRLVRKRPDDSRSGSG